MTNDKLSFEDLRSSIEALAEQLMRFVVPIFRVGKSGKPEAHGTGFLVSDSTNSFLISAAHVFDPISSGAELFFCIGSNRNRKLVGSKRLTISPESENREADRLDIGVLRLEGGASPPYPEIDKQALPMSALANSARPREGKQYLVTGFPGSKSRLNPVRNLLKSEPYGSWMPSADRSAYAQVGCSFESHIVMPFDHKRVFGKGETFRSAPYPAGMSGSPVWLLYDDMNENNPLQTAVCGVFTEYHSAKKLVVATDIGVALDMIRRAF